MALRQGSRDKTPFEAKAATGLSTLTLPRAKADRIETDLPEGRPWGSGRGGLAHGPGNGFFQAITWNRRGYRFPNYGWVAEAYSDLSL